MYGLDVLCGFCGEICPTAGQVAWPLILRNSRPERGQLACHQVGEMPEIGGLDLKLSGGADCSGLEAKSAYA